METIELNTTQNVSLQFPVASIADRILAFFFDAVIMGLYFILAAILIAQWFDAGTWEFIFLLLPPLFYHLLFELFFNGQTPGKRIMHIRVFKANGTALTAGSCFIRWIFRLADISLTSGALATLIIIINGKGQRLGDIAAKTTVLKISKKDNLQQTLWVDIEKDYHPRFPEVESLTDKDVQTIKEVVNIVNDSRRRPDNYVQLLVNTRKAIEQKTKTSSELSDIEFLTTIIKDYNAYHQRII
ncbi:RDD family protein [Thermophagus sp. OGC60D27]|uniref:RDD family protein n=1 Tax=Thermophagus sp. OGC60D27 TaxID=3458415 RepID=UPI004037A269